MTVTVSPDSGGYRPWRSCAVCGRKVPGGLYATLAEARAEGVGDATMTAYGHDKGHEGR